VEVAVAWLHGNFILAHQNERAPANNPRSWEPFLMGENKSRRLLFWQIGTLVLLVVGYSGYYLCRSNLSVVQPKLIAEMGMQGIDAGDAKVRLGTIASLGTLAYAIGKFLSGGLGDFLGGRRNFLGGMAGAVFFTILFTFAGGLPLLTVTWMGNRLVQSLGWVGMVKVSGRWFNYTAHGTVMAIVSLSYLWGDAAARAFMGGLLWLELGWRSIFLVDAGVLAAWFLLCVCLLRESPRAIGEEEGQANPLNLYGEAGNEATPLGLGALLLPMILSPSFWCVCLLSLALTLLRETFITWTPTYFTEAIHVQDDTAAFLSAGFPFLGGCAVILAGLISDLLGKSGRAAIIFVGMLLTAIALGGLSQLSAEQVVLAVGAVLLVGFLLLGPYSYLAGAVALDFGGKRGSSTACGIIDGVGYLGGVLAGDSFARVVRAEGWPMAFAVLAGVALFACAVAAVYWWNQARPAVEVKS
jgi:OPA family glycerol-3-phosphate transporter-like MFS transporter